MAVSSEYYCDTDTDAVYLCDCFWECKLLGVLLLSAFYQNDFVDVISLHRIPVMGRTEY